MKNRFIIYFVFLFAWIFGVIGIFWWIPDRKLAGVIAGVMFCGMPVTILLTEWYGFKAKIPLWYGAYLQFLLLFAFPILVLRLANWDMEFNEIQFLGFEIGRWLHRLSNISYLVMLLSNIVAFFSKKAEIVEAE